MTDDRSTTASPTTTSSGTDTALPVVVSGVQPTGTLHLGNYFGALRQHVDARRQPAPPRRGRLGARGGVTTSSSTTTRSRPSATPRRCGGYTFDDRAGLPRARLRPRRRHTCSCRADVPQLDRAGVDPAVPDARELDAREGPRVQGQGGSRASTANGGLLFTYPVPSRPPTSSSYTVTPRRRLVVPVGADQKQNIEVSRDTRRSASTRRTAPRPTRSSRSPRR